MADLFRYEPNYPHRCMDPAPDGKWVDADNVSELIDVLTGELDNANEQLIRYRAMFNERKPSYDERKFN